RDDAGCAQQPNARLAVEGAGTGEQHFRRRQDRLGVVSRLISVQEAIGDFEQLHGLRRERFRFTVVLATAGSAAASTLILVGKSCPCSCEPHIDSTPQYWDRR